MNIIKVLSNEQLKDALHYLNNISVIGLDIETTKKSKSITETTYFKGGLDPYLSKIIMLQLSDINNTYVIDARKVDISLLSFLFKDKSKTFVGHNLKFDVKHLLYNYNISPVVTYDTMLAEQIINCGINKPKNYYTLENLSSIYLGEKMTKNVRMSFINIQDETEFTDEQITYGAKDVINVIKIRAQQINKIIEINNKYNINLFNCLKLEFSFLTVLAKIELKGFYFNVKMWLEIAKKKEKAMMKLKNNLDAFIITNYLDTGFVNKQMDLFAEEFKCNIDWKSSKQVISFLKYVDKCPKGKSKYTKKIEYTAGSKDLIKLIPINRRKEILSDETCFLNTIDDFLIEYLKFKKVEQLCTTFGKDFIKYVHPITNRLHSSYLQMVKTGRMASTKPNNQNYPNQEEYRKCFTTQDKTSILINSDFSSQESRVLADLAQEKNMIEFFVSGSADLHSYTATKMFKIIYNDPEFICDPIKNNSERQKAKSLNFKLAYGGSAFTLKDDLGTTEEEAQKFIDVYFEAFPLIKNYFKKQEDTCMNTGVIVNNNFSYRICWLQNYELLEELKIQKKTNSKKYRSLYNELKRKTYNTPIQGTAVDQTKLAAILIQNYIDENNLSNLVYLVNIIHDEFILESHISIAEEIKNIVSEKMIYAAQYICKTVPMGCKTTITEYWKH